MRAGFEPFRCTKRAPASAGKLQFKSRGRLLLLLVAWSFTGSSLPIAGAAWGATPQPPRRPDQLNQPAASPSQNSQAAPSGRAPVDVDVDKLQPYNLPPASRAKMRQCGEEWRKLKMDGKSAGLIWRSFAEKCLTR